MLPFTLSGMVVGHIYFLHYSGSNNPLGLVSSSDKVPFHSFFVVKDIFGFIILASLFAFVVLLHPSLFLEPDNFIPANPMVTPSHIVPEWYFLFAYAVLRSNSRKLGGVFAILSSILVLLILSFSYFSSMKALSFYGPVKLVF